MRRGKGQSYIRPPDLLSDRDVLATSTTLSNTPSATARRRSHQSQHPAGVGDSQAGWRWVSAEPRWISDCADIARARARAGRSLGPLASLVGPLHARTRARISATMLGIALRCERGADGAECAEWEIEWCCWDGAEGELAIWSRRGATLLRVISFVPRGLMSWINWWLLSRMHRRSADFVSSCLRSDALERWFEVCHAELQARERTLTAHKARQGRGGAAAVEQFAPRTRHPPRCST